MRLSIIPLVLIISHMEPALSYKILAIFPSMSRSHFIVGKLLMEELAAAGHNVTVLSPYPRSEPMANYYDIDVQGVHAKMGESAPKLLDFPKMSYWNKFRFTYLMGFIITNHTLHHEKVHQLLNDPNEHFDLVIQEAFLNEALHGIAHHFKAPIIGLSTLGSSIWTNYMVGTPAPLSYVSSFYLALADKKTFCERVFSTAYAISEYIFHMHIYWPMQSKIYEEYFPGNKPSLWDLHRNVSLVLLNGHFSLNYPVPYVPNMIEVGGLQINRNRKKLPEDLQKVLDNAKNGVIFFSLGSNIRAVDLAPEQKSAVLSTFSKLKHQVLWKLDENLPNQPKNVLIQSWFPQEDLMAHPNLKLFITHGGLLSITEAAYHGVPLLGIPLFADQEMNMIKVSNEGMGLTLKLDDLNEESFLKLINEILDNKKYSENMKRISQLYRDQPMTPIQTAMFWIEYVLRHKGAPHLRSAAQDLNFIQYHNLDVFALITGIIIIGLSIITFILKALFCRRSKFIAQKVKRN